MTDILDKLADLYKQATEERSHYYTGSVIKEAITHIAGLRVLAAIAQRPDAQSRLSAGNARQLPAYVSNAAREAARDALDDLETNTRVDSDAYTLAQHMMAFARLLNEPQAVQVPAEHIARVIALSCGRDPDEMTEWTEMCDADNRPVPVWRVYEEQAESLLAAYSVTRPHGGGK